MASGDTEFFAGTLGGVLIGGMLAFFIGIMIPPTESEKTGIVCEYHGGEIQGEVCIKDGEVLEFDTK